MQITESESDAPPGLTNFPVKNARDLSQTVRKSNNQPLFQNPINMFSPNPPPMVPPGQPMFNPMMY